MFEFVRKLARLRSRDALNARLREELEFHSTMAGGDIGRQSRIVEEAHDVWTLGWLEHVFADIRHAWRALAKSPAFFALATAGTALGIAAVTSVLSVADRAFLRPLPYLDADRLVIVADQLLKLGMARVPTSFVNLEDYRAQTSIFEDIAAFSPRPLTVSTGEGAERVPGMTASSNLSRLLRRGALVVRRREIFQSCSGGRELLADEVELRPQHICPNQRGASPCNRRCGIPIRIPRIR
jgi:hypothetical protein